MWREKSDRFTFVHNDPLSLIWSENNSTGLVRELVFHNYTESKDIILYDEMTELYVLLTSSQVLTGPNDDQIDEVLGDGEWEIEVPEDFTFSVSVATTSEKPKTTTVKESDSQVFVINTTMTVEDDIGASFDLYCAEKDIENKVCSDQFFHLI